MPDAKVVVKNATKFVTQAQSGARAVNMPTAVSNNAAHGSRVVGGPSGHSTNNGQTRVAVIQTPPMRERVQPRPGVAPRPNQRNPGGTRAAVIPTPVAAPLLTPLTVDQGMFLIHLVDSFMVAQKAQAAESNGTVPKDLEEIASATMTSLNAWTGALSSGAAQTTTATPPAAPAVG